MSSESSGPASVNTATNSNPDFKATFTLLPHVLKIAKTIQTPQSDPQKQQAQIQTAVTELQSHIQLCQQLLSAYPCLDGNPEQQKKELEAKKKQLHHKCDLLLKYKNLEILSQQTSNPSYVQ